MISAYLTDEIVIRYLSTLDQWNTGVFNDVTVMARVEWSNKLVRNTQGELVVASAKVYLSGDIDQAPTLADRILIDGVEHAIMRVDKKTAFSTSHYECWIQ
ncbi:MAG: hypothetical protein WC329_05150 [Candidatus Omnitrophota bacterium]|jgi:hypothetical protein